jgi:hypothetical protein
MQFFTGPQLRERYDRDRTTLYRWIRTGFLPAPDLILKGHPRWTAQTIEAFEQRNGMTPPDMAMRPRITL